MVDSSKQQHTNSSNNDDDEEMVNAINNQTRNKYRRKKRESKTSNHLIIESEHFSESPKNSTVTMNLIRKKVNFEKYLIYYKIYCYIGG